MKTVVTGDIGSLTVLVCDVNNVSARPWPTAMDNPDRHKPILNGRRFQALLARQSGINAFPELLAWFEVGYMLGRQCD